jgi:CO dehydrogenase maturation factor
VRSLLGAAIEEEADLTLVDMEAGLEHLSRSGGTLAYADVLLMVMEPSRKSILTAQRTLHLADELGIPKSYGVGNKARLPEDAEFFQTVAAEYGVPLAGIVPHDPAVVEADRSNHVLSPEQAPAVRKAVAEIAAVVDATVAAGNGGGAEREALLRERERVDERLAQLQRAD